MRRLAPCRACGTDTLVPAGAPLSPRAVCTTCGRCWEDWGTGAEVDLTNLDYCDHFAWAAFGIDSPGGPGLGVARYIRDPNHPTTAEAAVTVLDEYQHRGLGSLLLLMLVDEASRHGIRSFVNYVMWENEELLDELRAAGGRVEPDEPGVARVEIDFPPPEEPSRLDIGRAILRWLAQATRQSPVGIRPPRVG